MHVAASNDRQHFGRVEDPRVSRPRYESTTAYGNVLCQRAGFLLVGHDLRVSGELDLERCFHRLPACVLV